jgi:hypothetical protein
VALFAIAWHVSGPNHPKKRGPGYHDGYADGLYAGLYAKPGELFSPPDGWSPPERTERPLGTPSFADIYATAFNAYVQAADDVRFNGLDETARESSAERRAAATYAEGVVRSAGGRIPRRGEIA